MKHQIEFEKLKVGQTVWTVADGYCDIQSLDAGCLYPIKAGTYTYTKEGLYSYASKHPSLFLSNPFESDERVVEVRDSATTSWVRRVFIKELNGCFLCWDVAETIEDSKRQTRTCGWQFMREIQPTLELTLEEIAAKYGVDSVKIIDK